METLISVNLKERSFTISGTEEFVERNYNEKYRTRRNWNGK